MRLEEFKHTDTLSRGGVRRVSEGCQMGYLGRAGRGKTREPYHTRPALKDPPQTRRHWRTPVRDVHRAPAVPAGVRDHAEAPSEGLHMTHLHH